MHLLKSLFIIILKVDFKKYSLIGIQMKTYNLDKYNTSKLNYKTEKNVKIYIFR